MKKIFTFVIAIAMLISGACAESIFPALNTGVTEITAISFGAVAGVMPEGSMTLIDGSTQQVYTGVSVEQYNQFGAALGQAGYVLESQNAVDGGVELVVTDGSVRLNISYLTSDGRLTVTYPQGVTPEKAVPNLFPRYETVKLGDTVSIPGYGSLTLSEMTFDGDAALMQYLGLGIYSEYYSFFDHARVYLTGSFTNTDTSDIHYNDIMDCTLYYVTGENTYSYPMHYTAMENEDGSIYVGSSMQSSGVNFDLVSGSDYPFPLTGPYIDSLESGNFACVFRDVPDAVVNADSGVIAITIEIPGNNGGYVVYLRY